MKDIIVVVIVCVTIIAFPVIGVYALQCGFIKTGGWLVAAGIIGLLALRIKINDKKKEAEDA